MFMVIKDFLLAALKFHHIFQRKKNNSFGYQRIVQSWSYRLYFIEKLAIQ